MLASGCSSLIDTPTIISKDVILISQRNTQIHATFVYPKHQNVEKLVVFAHGFGGSQDARGLFSESAQRLSEKGIASIRIDFAGHGKSKESMKGYTITYMEDDLETAITYAKTALKISDAHIGIMGYSMGGAAVGMLLERQTFSAVLLLAPAIATGYDVAVSLWGNSDRLNRMLKESESDDLISVTAWGEEFVISRVLLQELLTIDPLSNIRSYQGNLMMITGGMDTVIPETITNQVIVNAIQASMVKHVVYPQTGHDFGTTSADQNEVVKQAVLHDVETFFATVL